MILVKIKSYRFWILFRLGIDFHEDGLFFFKQRILTILIGLLSAKFKIVTKIFLFFASFVCSFHF